MAGAKGRSGRPATTSHEEIAKHAVALFEERGYGAVSVTDIATSVGIARRTFFSYFASKADAFWWQDENDLKRVVESLANVPRDDVHPIQQVIDIALESPSWIHPTKETARSHYLMIESNPELQIGAQRFQRRWGSVIAQHLRDRIGATKSDLLPEVITSALIGVAQTVIVRWAYSDDERPLPEVFHENIELVRAAFEETVAEKLLH